MKSIVVASFMSVAFSSAWANCPTTPPSASKVALQPGDQKVNAAWLQKTLAGKKVKFDGGTEVYKKNGSYVYKSANGTYEAPGYKFFDNGFRCIAYAKPRFDYYVVNGGTLFLINSNGGRFAGNVTK